MANNAFRERCYGWVQTKFAASSILPAGRIWAAAEKGTGGVCGPLDCRSDGKPLLAAAPPHARPTAPKGRPCRIHSVRRRRRNAWSHEEPDRRLRLLRAT